MRKQKRAGNAATTNKHWIMQKLSFLAAVAAILTLNVTLSTRADEPLLSPRAKSNQTRVVPSAGVSEPNLVAIRPIGNARAWQLDRSLRTVPSTGPSVDLAHAPRATLSPKDPGYEAAQRAIIAQQYQVAPLK